MLQKGYDVTRGTTQLGCVTEHLEGSSSSFQRGESHATPLASAAMSQLVYLPVGPEMGPAAVEKMVQCLRDALGDPGGGGGALGEGGLQEAAQASPMWHVAAALLAFSLAAVSIQCLGCKTLLLLAVVLGALGVPLVIFGWERLVRALVPELLGPSPILHHFRDLPPEEHERRVRALEEVCPSNLDGEAVVVDGEDVRSAQQVGQQVVVLMTGATGFLGQLHLADLLRHAEALRIQRVIVLCRGCTSKGPVAVQTRLDKLRDGEAFQGLEDAFQEKVIGLEGDVTRPECGLSLEDQAFLEEAGVTHVIHCAASVLFDQPLHQAASVNIGGALRVKVRSDAERVVGRPLCTVSLT